MSEPFVSLLNNEKSEVMFKKSDDLMLMAKAIDKAIQLKSEDMTQLLQLKNILAKKMKFSGTKVQLKPAYSKTDGSLEKLTVIVKWGGEVSYPVLIFDYESFC